MRALDVARGKRVTYCRPVRAFRDGRFDPVFLNSPFSCAMTIGEQSVRAMIPNFSLLVSGASLAGVDRHTARHALSNAPSAEVRATDWTASAAYRSADIFRMAKALAAHMPTGALKRRQPQNRNDEPNSFLARLGWLRFAKGVIDVARQKTGRRNDTNRLKVYKMAISNMPIDSRQLRAFAALARTGSFRSRRRSSFSLNPPSVTP